jgi:hypothetical protein
MAAEDLIGAMWYKTESIDWSLTDAVTTVNSVNLKATGIWWHQVSTRASEGGSALLEGRTHITQLPT